MKLFAWKPQGHGEYSFFVCAKDEVSAIDAVDKYIKDHLGKDDGHYLTDYEVQGWKTDYYELTEVNAGVVVTNDNS